MIIFDNRIQNEEIATVPPGGGRGGGGGGGMGGGGGGGMGGPREVPEGDGISAQNIE